MKFLKTYKLFEYNSDVVLNNILDKINKVGQDNLYPEELKYLIGYSNGSIDKELEKALTVEEGTIFASKKIPNLTFKYYDTEERDDYIEHFGTVEYTGLSIMDGSIYENEDGSYAYSEFYENEEVEDGMFEPGISLYESLPEEKDLLDEFFSNEIFPYLKYK